ncbi:ABC-2 family transporter protein [Anatilimnocola aggregata]|uniref:ABC-2 family transporter protein n=1 Tax=Anatilimnocola aggregata TaxID=2528021 RepID=A0A517YG47_9BACT|nr:ABC transporter permease subunit/CPBP intramembrane protease [Anatilimnocola aggregata]QDU29189.1 ABC-2 family transporter protein [Anatilimnocola aggregata]
MSWTNIRLIYLRELRDQLRDRRTLFTIVILPLLMYPLLAMVWCQMQQFLKEQPSKVRIVGVVNLPQQPTLLENGEFPLALCSDNERRLLTLQIDDNAAVPSEPLTIDDLREAAERDIKSGLYDAVVYFPPEFGKNIDRLRRGKEETAADQLQVTDLDAIPQPEIFADSASDASRVALNRVDLVLRRWREVMVHDNLIQSDVPLGAARPFELVNTDVAETFRRRAAIWSKVLPFVLLIWALTGAFYPAVDLCAGEKERGTLETLLVSPAQRDEIVWGKLLCVTTFSMATSLLNLVCMGLTGSLFFMQMASNMASPMMMDLGPPPLSSLCWLALALAPISALFSALALAIAAFARSTKEGQYYLMPLLLVSLPLMVLPLLPQVRLDLGFSLIPVTGVMLLLRALMEGQYLEALRYSPFVIGITALCCWLSIRWAIRQFNSEAVLFRESERFGLGLWLRHLVRDRQDTPSPAEAIACGILLLFIRFIASFTIPMPSDWTQFAVTTLVVQVALIATPACLMAIMLTRKPRQTLLLQAPSFWSTVPAAMLLAMLLHPALMLLGAGIREVYPLSEETLRALAPLESLLSHATLPELLLLVAVVPAICEELAFRGFILSGLRRLGHKWTAIAICSVLFGVAHGLLQQSLAAAVVGMVIGYIAVKTNSLLPAMAYHFVHNGLGVLHSRITPELLDRWYVLDAVVSISNEGGIEYRWTATVIAALLGVLILLWIKRLPYHPCAEERLQQALARQSVPVPT